MTGSTGFVGRALSNFLTEHGHTVIGLVHDIDALARHELSPQAFVIGDVRDYAFIRRVITEYKPNAIIHLAAQAIVKTCNENPYNAFDINVRGTYTLLSAILDSKQTPWILHFSTDKVYGEGFDKKESDPLQATGMYGASKAAADMVAQAFMPVLSICITRSANIYGPGDKTPTRLFPNIIDPCVHGHSPIIRMPDALTTREYIYIDDVCRIVTQLINARKIGIWNIGSLKVISTQKLIYEILKHFPNITPKTEKHTDHVKELYEQSLNTDKLRSELDGFSFTTLEKGIQRTVEWWKSQSS